MKPLYKIISILILSGLIFTAGRCSKHCISFTTIDNYSHRDDSISLVNKYLDVAVKDLLIDVKRRDSINKVLKEQKPILITKYLKAKEGRSAITSDSLADLVIFDRVTDACDSIRALNDKLISHQEYRDTALLKVIDIQKTELDNKDIIIADQSETIAKSVMHIQKLQKKVRRNRVISAIALAFGVVGVVK